MTNKKENMEFMEDIVNRIHEFPDYAFEENLADIYERISDITIYTRVEENDTGKSNPDYYALKTAQSLHKSASEAYTNMYTNDVKQKALLITDLVALEKKVAEIEKRSESKDEK